MFFLSVTSRLEHNYFQDDEKKLKLHYQLKLIITLNVLYNNSSNKKSMQNWKGNKNVNEYTRINFESLLRL